MTQKEIIKALKENTSAFGLMPEELQEAARKIAGDNFEIYDGTCWCRAVDVAFNLPYEAYRLRPDYQPEPEYEKFEIEKGQFNRYGCDIGEGSFEYLVTLITNVRFSHFEKDDGNKIDVEDIATYLYNGGKVFVVLRKE